MYLFLPGSLVLEQVHVHGEGDVLDHDKHVCHGDAGEDEVDGVPPHVLVGEHEYVYEVEEGAHGADHQGQVAVDRLVLGLVEVEVKGLLHRGASERN